MHALLLIDLQVDYFSDDELARCRDDLAAACNRLVHGAREAGLPVIEVVTEHAPDGSTWALNMRDDDSPLVVAGTPGADPLPELDLDHALVVKKTRDSAFFGTGLDQTLKELGVDGLVLAGVSTESCISATAADAYAHDLRVVLARDATASVDEVRHERTLAELEQQYRQPARWVDDIVRDWVAPAG